MQDKDNLIKEKQHLYLLINEKEKKNNELLKEEKEYEKNYNMFNEKLEDLKRFVDEL